MKLEAIQKRISKVSEHGRRFLILYVTLSQVSYKLIEIVVFGIALRANVVHMMNVDDVPP